MLSLPKPNRGAAFKVNVITLPNVPTTWGPFSPPSPNLVMKTGVLFLSTLVLATAPAFGQAVLLADQFSSMNESVFPDSGSIIQNGARPFGQSFTPSLSRVDFIRLNMNDADPGNGIGATLNLVLHSDSMSGPVLGSTPPVVLSDGSSAITSFFFPATVAVTPNTTYYLEVLVQPLSDSWGIISSGYGYLGGSVFVGGGAQVASDL
jgi:hypothetical protein